jgi:hypothetical protein
VIITAEKVFVINFKEDTIELEVPHDKLIGTGPSLEGVGVPLCFEGKGVNKQGRKNSNTEME